MSAALPALAAIALAAALAAPALAGEDLYQRNLAALLATLPEGAVLEVRVAGPDGGEAVELWTAAEYASFRADVAARMGRDYTAAPEAVPAGLGDQQYIGDNWSDLWGATTLSFQVPRGSCLLPRTIPIDAAPPVPLPPVTLAGSSWWYGGADSRCVVGEHVNACLGTRWGSVCSNTYGWTLPQGGYEHGDAWFAGWGFFTLFPPPHGAIAMFNGVLLAEDPA